MAKITQSIAAVLIGTVLLGFANWSTINRWNINGDLRDYARVVRRSSILLSEKEQLLDQIELLEDQIAEEQINWLDWRRHDETIREMLRGGVDGGEVSLVVRELKRIEKRLDQ